MPFSDIANRVYVDSTVATDPSVSSNTIVTTLMTIYENSSAGAAMLSWLNADPSRIFQIHTSPGNANAQLNQGIVNIDPSFPEIYITKAGNAVNVSFEAVLTHEIGHAVTNNRDNDSFSNLDGDNITNINSWLVQLGLPEQASYNTGFLQSGAPIVNGKDYTHGHAIVNAIVDRGGVYDNTLAGGFSFDTTNFDLTASSVTGSTLIVGGAGNDTYKGTSADDWIYTGGGTDTVDGGAGNDVIIADSGTVTTKFAAGGGYDVAEVGTGAGTYNLDLTSLNPADISIIAGGEDLYGGYSYYAGQVAFEWVAIKINSTGETITFLNKDRSIGSSASPAPTYAEAGITYAKANSAISSITFAGSVTWSSSDLWDRIEDKYNNTNVSYELMFRGTGTRTGNLRVTETNENDYNAHLNSTYLRADPLTVPSARSAARSSMVSESEEPSSVSPSTSAAQLVSAISAFDYRERAFGIIDTISDGDSAFRPEAYMASGLRGMEKMLAFA